MVMETNNGFDPAALEKAAAHMTYHCHPCFDRAPEKDEKKVATSVAVAESGKVDAAPLRRLKEARAVLKGKARAAGEYAALVTRQGVSMFGEPKIDSMVKAGADVGGGSAMRWASVIRNKVWAAAGEYYAAITAHRRNEPDTGSKAEGGGPNARSKDDQ